MLAPFVAAGDLAPLVPGGDGDLGGLTKVENVIPSILAKLVEELSVDVGWTGHG